MILDAVINHWKIENNMHQCKDLILLEDQIRLTKLNITINLASMNKLTLAFINFAQEISCFETKITQGALLIDGLALPHNVIQLAGSKR